MLNSAQDGGNLEEFFCVYDFAFDVIQVVIL